MDTHAACRTGEAAPVGRDWCLRITSRRSRRFGERLACRPTSRKCLCAKAAPPNSRPAAICNRHRVIRSKVIRSRVVRSKVRRERNGSNSVPKKHEEGGRRTRCFGGGRQVRSSAGGAGRRLPGLVYMCFAPGPAVGCNTILESDTYMIESVCRLPQQKYERFLQCILYCISLYSDCTVSCEPVCSVAYTDYL